MESCGIHRGRNRSFGQSTHRKQQTQIVKVKAEQSSPQIKTINSEGGMWFCVVCVLGKTVISDKTLAKKQNNIYWG